MLLCVISILSGFQLKGQNRLVDLHVSSGKSSKHIQLRWSALAGVNQYIIYRTDRVDGTFSRIASVVATRYNDTNCKPGIEYFYKVSAEPHSKETDFSVVKTGYRRIDLSDTYTLKNILAKKDQDIPYIRSVDKKRLQQLEPYYLSWIKLRLILFASRPYLYNNRITILTHFDSVTFNSEQNIIEMSPHDETFQLLFYGRDPFELLDKTGDTELLKRLVQNSIAFSVYKGETKIRDSSGRNKYIPQYEAVGLLTQYFKYSKNWASESILFSSNRKDIIKEVEEQ